MRNDNEFYNSIGDEINVGDLIKLEAYVYVHQHGCYEPVVELESGRGIYKWERIEKPKMTLLVKRYQPDNRRWERTYWAEDIATGDEWLLQPKESQAFSYVGNKTTERGTLRTEWNPTDYWMRVRL